MHITTNQDLYDAIKDKPGKAKVKVVIGDRYIDVVQVNHARENDFDNGTIVLQLDTSQFKLDVEVKGIRFK